MNFYKHKPLESEAAEIIINELLNVCIAKRGFKGKPDQYNTLLALVMKKIIEHSIKRSNGNLLQSARNIQINRNTQRSLCDFWEIDVGGIKKDIQETKELGELKDQYKIAKENTEALRELLNMKTQHLTNNEGRAHGAI